MHFDLDDLKLVALIAETGSLSAAAARLHRSLAAVSARVQNLEERGGMRFFERGARGVTPTAPGLALVHHARAMLGQVERLNGDLRQYADGLRAHVRVFANTTAVSDFLPEILARFLAAHPDVDVDLQEQLNDDITRAVRDGTVDLGIAAGSIESEGLRAIHFSTDRLVLVVPARHRLARRKQVAFADTLDEPHVGMHEGSTLHRFLTHVVEGSGRIYRLRIRLHGFDAMCRMIEAGAGIGVVPESAAIRHRRTMDIAILPLTDPWTVRERYVLVRDGATLSDAAQALLRAVVDAQASASASTSKVRRRSRTSPRASARSRHLSRPPARAS